jgi:hypothetical protein
MSENRIRRALNSEGTYLNRPIQVRIDGSSAGYIVSSTV